MRFVFWPATAFLYLFCFGCTSLVGWEKDAALLFPVPMEEYHQGRIVLGQTFLSFLVSQGGDNQKEREDAEEIVSYVSDWQKREKDALYGVSSSHPHLFPFFGFLGKNYEIFFKASRLALLRSVLEWVQGISKEYYRSDGSRDFWPTTAEAMADSGEDCDGLELLVYNFLLSFGFSEEEVYRAVIKQEDQNYSHMVTFWFENGSSDPWVLDPTGYASGRLVKMSELPSWRIRVFFNRSIGFFPISSKAWPRPKI